MKKVRTRIAPSPTGYFHVGTARTALFNFIFAKQNNGTFVLRIEDTDTKRNKSEFEADILDSMNWLGLTPDKTYHQSKLVENHKEAIQTLIDSDKAFISKEPSKEDDSKEVSVVRLRNIGEIVTFTDLIRGEISFNTTELGDFVVARSINEPLYHLAVVVDDNEMNITHVIRGEDHISNTARQILIQRALGYVEPQYAHLPLILAPDKSKLSKRKHSFAVIRQLREDGFEAHAIVNYLTLLGWSPKDGREVISLEDTILEFDISNVHKSGAVFDIEKLKWINRDYFLKMDDKIFSDRALHELKSLHIDNYSEQMAFKIIPLLKEKIGIWSDIREMVIRGELDLFFTQPTLDVQKLCWKEVSREKTIEHLKKLIMILTEANDSDFASVDQVKKLIWQYAEDQGRGDVLWPLRFSLSGREKSPDPFTLLTILGKIESLSRINKAIL
jgi:glutamyl-tRNA synthetase